VNGDDSGNPPIQYPVTISVGNRNDKWVRQYTSNNITPSKTWAAGLQTTGNAGNDIAVIFLDPPGTSLPGARPGPAWDYAQIVHPSLTSPCPTSGCNDANGGIYLPMLGMAGWAPVDAPVFRQVAYDSGFHHYPGRPDDRGQYWERVRGSIDVDPGDSGGPLFVRRPDPQRPGNFYRDVIGVLSSKDSDYDRWADITRGAIADWVRSALADPIPRGPNWKAAHPNMIWYGDVDYVGVCQQSDADCDHIYDYHDNCPSISNPDQRDTLDNGVGDACRAPIQSLTPSFGPASGNAKVVIQGQGPFFISVTAVKFGGVPAISYTVDSASQITAFTPPFTDTAPYASRVVDVTITMASGQISGGPTMRYTYIPVVKGVDPRTGPIAISGKFITVTGAGFALGHGTDIAFGTLHSSNVSCKDTTSCSAELPQSSTPGSVHVIASVAGLSSQPGSDDIFNYVSPSITKLDPAVGTEDGGDRVYIYGLGLTDNMTFKFDNTVVKTACFTDTYCEAFSPRGTGTARVTVTWNGITSAPATFTYAKFPSVGGIVPATGLATGGDRVTIIGTNFSATAGATSVAFGPNAAKDVQCSTTQCTAAAPAGTSLVDVIVSVGTLASPKNPTDQFSYIPVITGVSPGNGVARGGTAVTISGAGLVSTQYIPGTLVIPATSIKFGTNPASSIACTATTCTANTPSGSGTVDVQAVVDGHPSPLGPAARFTYAGSGISKGWTQWQLPIPYSGGDSMIYDPVRHNVLYITENLDDSGNSQVDQTWLWDPASGSWTQQSVQTGPKVTDAMLAFDETRGTAVLFGGIYHKKTGNIGFRNFFDNSTWIWDGTGWAAASPSVNPPARIYANMTYDAARSRIILFGGCSDTACKNPLNDTWTWDGANWKQETPAVSPSARHQGIMAYDPALAKVVLFGGGDNLSGALGDMFAWDGQSWAEMHPAATPPARYGAAMAYSHIDSGLVMFGGTGVAGYLPETWLWNGAAWTRLNVTAGPSVAFNIAGMAYDAAMDATVLIVDGQLWTWGGQ
jgi:hypothetical protein